MKKKKEKVREEYKLQKSVNLELQQRFFLPTHYSVKQLWIKACKECLVRQKIGNYCKKNMLLQELWCLAQDYYIIRRRKIGTAKIYFFSLFLVWSNYKCNFEMSPTKKEIILSKNHDSLNTIVLKKNE